MNKKKLVLNKELNMPKKACAKCNLTMVQNLDIEGKLQWSCVCGYEEEIKDEQPT